MGEVGVRGYLCMGIGSILGDELSPKDWSNSKLFGDLGIRGGDELVIPDRPSEAVRKSIVLESFFTVN